MTDEEIEAKIEARVREEVERRHSPLSWLVFLITLGLALSQFVILVSVIPRFEEMFKEMDIGELPKSTLFLLLISRYGWMACISVIAAAAFAHRTKHTGLLVVLSGMLLFFFSFEVLALFMPLIKIMDRLSGGSGH